jgi:predicted permease
MKYLFVFLFSIFAFGQKAEIKEIQKFQADLNAEYKNPEESPLRGNLLKDFKAIPF